MNITKGTIVIIFLNLVMVCAFSMLILRYFVHPDKDSAPPGIICFGDSLTLGYGGDGVSYPGELGKKYGLNVVNAGVEAENSISIVCRSNSMSFEISDEMNVPPEKAETEISLQSEDGRTINSLRIYPGNEWHVTIKDDSGNAVKGTLRIVQDSPYTDEYHYTFERDAAGDEIHIAKGGRLIPDLYAEYDKYRDYMPVIFIGQNGGWDSPEDLAEQCRLIAQHYGNGKDYLIIGLHTQNAEVRAELENYMTSAFGDHYINLREYMCSKAALDAGITLSEEDKKRVEMGMTPTAFMSDEIHFNAKGYSLLADLVYKRYLEQISD